MNLKMFLKRSFYIFCIAIIIITSCQYINRANITKKEEGPPVIVGDKTNIQTKKTTMKSSDLFNIFLQITSLKNKKNIIQYICYASDHAKGEDLKTLLITLNINEEQIEINILKHIQEFIIHIIETEE